MATPPFDDELIEKIKKATKWKLTIKAGEVFIPEFYYYKPGTKTDKATYGSLPDGVRVSIQKRQLIEWLNEFLEEDEIIDTSDLEKPDKFTTENYLIKTLSRAGKTDKEIARFISTKVGYITTDAVKKRRQRLKNR
ncbi:MAG: hypothetical protein JXM69_06320 [Anaerolineae bacterium]|nr:hypothetical protein [Anaerolineae bacterium]